MTVTLVDAPEPRNMGWECPRCHSCYAPTVLRCTVCRPNYSSLPPRPAVPDITKGH